MDLVPCPCGCSAWTTPEHAARMAGGAEGVTPPAQADRPEPGPEVTSASPVAAELEPLAVQATPGSRSGSAPVDDVVAEASSATDPDAAEGGDPFKYSRVIQLGPSWP